MTLPAPVLEPLMDHVPEEVFDALTDSNETVLDAETSADMVSELDAMTELDAEADAVFDGDADRVAALEMECVADADAETLISLVFVEVDEIVPADLVSDVSDTDDDIEAETENVSVCENDNIWDSVFDFDTSNESDSSLAETLEVEDFE